LNSHLSVAKKKLEMCPCVVTYISLLCILFRAIQVDRVCISWCW